MEFEILGPLGVRHEGEAHLLPGRMLPVLLGTLLVRANQAVSADVLVDALWGSRRTERPEQALQVHVHRLRRALGESDRLAHGPGGYRLTVRLGELDADRFETLVDEAAEVLAQDPERSVELARKALELWRGRPFEDLDVPELVAEADRLADRRLAATEVLYEAELTRGRDSSVIADLTELVRQHPLRERLHGLLMAALYRAGRQADALQVFRGVRQTLVDELGLEPGPELQAIEQKILAGEPVEVGAPTTRSGPRPAQLPANVSGFVGRESALGELDGLANLDGEETAPIVAITGTAGVGKTALAVRWAHQVKDQFSDGQLYVDLRGYGPDQPVEPGDALAGFLRALGAGGPGAPQDLAERSAQFRSLVDGRRMLVVLDNARTADQVRPLLPGSSSCVALVTSRGMLSSLAAREGARRIDLELMTDDEARGLLRQFLSERGDADPAGLDPLIALCARLPLALRIAAERIRERHDQSMATLVEELTSEQSRLDALDTGEDVSTSVRAVFSWSYGQLPADAARLFRRFGLHPGRDVDAYALSALFGSDDLRGTRRLLDVLVRAHLVDEIAAGRYQLHDLLWTYAGELARVADNAEECAEARHRLIDYYLHAASRAMDLFAPEQGDAMLEPSSPPPVPALSDHDSALAWLDTERANLIAAAEWAAEHGNRQDTIRFAAILWCYLDTSWHLDDARRLHERALALARDLGDPTAEGVALLASGLLHHRTWRNTDAARELERALALHEQLGDQRMQVITLYYLGAACYILDRIEEATHHMERSLELARDLDSAALQVSPSAGLGGLYLWQGRFDQASQVLTQARRLADDHDIRWVQPRILVNLAQVCLETGQHEESLDYLLRALRLARKAQMRGHELNVMHHLGVVYQRLGDVVEAMKHHREALAAARTLGEGSLEVAALIGLAETHAATGSIDEAATHYDEALALASAGELGEYEARAHAGLGDVYDERGDRSKAVEHWERALDIYRVVRSPKADDVAAKLAGSAG